MSYKEPCDSDKPPREKFVVIPSSDPRLGADQTFHVVEASADSTPEEVLKLVGHLLQVPGEYLVFRKSSGKNLRIENSVTVNEV